MALSGRELYGLEIITAVADASVDKRKIGFGSLYPTLHKLEKKGLVKARWGEDTPEERAGARRRYSAITGLGERAVKKAQQVRDSLLVCTRSKNGVIDEATQSRRWRSQ